MRRIHFPNIYLVTGLPNQGKTSFAVAFGKIKSLYQIDGLDPKQENLPCYIISTDRLFYLCIGEDPASSKVSILSYIHTRLDKGQKDFLKEFFHYLKPHLLEALAAYPVELIVEGYALNFIKDEIREFLKDHGAVHHIRIRNHTIHCDELVLKASSDLNPVNAYDERMPEIYRSSLFRLWEHIRKKQIERVKPRLTYQSFQDLGLKVANSNSEKKLHKLALPLNLKEKRILDIGCNTGLMPIQFRLRGASVVGLDYNEDFLKTASEVANTVYRLDGVSFYLGDVFEYEGSGFDYVVAASVFHYFRERQAEFMEKAASWLKPGGVLVLECGVSEERREEPHIQKFKRGVDPTPCFFPNVRAYVELAPQFSLEFFGSSVAQPGDPIPRKVIHFKKK